LISEIVFFSPVCRPFSTLRFQSFFPSWALIASFLFFFSPPRVVLAILNPFSAPNWSSPCFCLWSFSTTFRPVLGARAETTTALDSFFDDPGLGPAGHTNLPPCFCAFSPPYLLRTFFCLMLPSPPILPCRFPPPPPVRGSFSLSASCAPFFFFFDSLHLESVTRTNSCPSKQGTRASF